MHAEHHLFRLPSPCQGYALMYLPFVLMLQWFNLGFHYRGGFIMYGQLLMVVTETGPQSRMFTVGSVIGLACSLQWAENMVQGLDLK